MAATPMLYECYSVDLEEWVPCKAMICVRERRVNQKIDALVRLESYRMKRDAKLPLEKIEQDDLDLITENIISMMESLSSILQDTLLPALQRVGDAAKRLWDSLPEDMQKALAGSRAETQSVATQVSPKDEAFQNVILEARARLRDQKKSS